MKSTGILVCNLLLAVLFSSCHETKKYQFNVINLTDKKEIIIEFNTELGRSSKKIKVDFTNQNTIILREDDFISGYTVYGNHDIFFYPSIFILGNVATFDAVIFDNPKVEKEDQLFKITPCEGVYKYYLYLLVEGSIIRFFSDTPIINLEEINNLDIDITYIEDPPETLMNEMLNIGFKGGYVVRSSIDGSMLLLN